MTYQRCSEQVIIWRTHQHYHHQWLPNTEWSNSRRSAEQGTDGYVGKDSEKTRVYRQEWKTPRAEWAGWWRCTRLIANSVLNIKQTITKRKRTRNFKTQCSSDKYTRSAYHLEQRVRTAHLATQCNGLSNCRSDHKLQRRSNYNSHRS